MQLETSRLILRRWLPYDIEPFAAMNADAEVMEFFPRRFSHEQTTAMVETIEADFNAEGFGLWALETKETGEFIGYTGLGRLGFDAHFTPNVEVGWRLARAHWGKGFAPEAAAEAMRDGFERIGLNEVVALTAAINKKSIRVMEKLQMRSDPKENFLHPAVAADSILELHVLYRLSLADWQRSIRAD